MKRWPMLIVTVGFAVHAVNELASPDGVGGAGVISRDAWALMSALCAGAALWIALSRSAVPIFAGSIFTVLVGIARGASYASAGTFGPLGVWMVVTGLTVAAMSSYLLEVDRRVLGR